MKHLKIISSLIFLLAAFTVSLNAAPKTITWDDLVPTERNAATIDFDKLPIFGGEPDESEFEGSKQAMDEYLDFMESRRDMQPRDGDALVAKLDNQEVKIAGYVTPLYYEGDEIVEFLFVPYLGACIHVPPPAANQIVFVKNAKGLKSADIYDPVWLTGRLKTTPISTIVADVGYSISGAKIEPYTE